MSTRSELFLHEEILLLALHDEKGTIAMDSNYTYAVAGALIAELIVRRRIEVVSGKKRFVQVVSPTPVGEPLLDEALARIAGAKRRAVISTWVSRLAGTRKQRDRIAEGLRRRGILRFEEREVLLVFSRKTWPVVDPEPERRIVERLRSAIFDGQTPDARTTVLLSLTDRAGILSRVFDRKALKERKRRIAELVADESIGADVKQAIEAAQAVAIMISTT